MAHPGKYITHDFYALVIFSLKSFRRVGCGLNKKTSNVAFRSFNNNQNVKPRIESTHSLL